MLVLTISAAVLLVAALGWFLRRSLAELLGLRRRNRVSEIVYSAEAEVEEEFRKARDDMYRAAGVSEYDRNYFRR